MPSDLLSDSLEGRCLFAIPKKGQPPLTLPLPTAHPVAQLLPSLTSRPGKIDS